MPGTKKLPKAERFHFKKSWQVRKKYVIVSDSTRSIFLRFIYSTYPYLNSLLDVPHMLDPGSGDPLAPSARRCLDLNHQIMGMGL